MEELTEWQKVCAYEALKMALEAVKDWLPRTTKVRKPFSNEEVEVLDEVKAQYMQDIDSALSTLATLNKETFNISDMFKSGHTNVVHNCLEFYGEYMHAMLGFVGHMYRLTYKEMAGMFPEEAIALMQKEQSQTG